MEPQAAASADEAAEVASAAPAAEAQPPAAGAAPAAAAGGAPENSAAAADVGWRVKLYELTEDGNWRDLGTAYASAEQVSDGHAGGRPFDRVPPRDFLVVAPTLTPPPAPTSARTPPPLQRVVPPNDPLATMHGADVTEHDDGTTTAPLIVLREHAVKSPTVKIVTSIPISGVYAYKRQQGACLRGCCGWQGAARCP